jgi:hypothetical protein
VKTGAHVDPQCADDLKTAEKHTRGGRPPKFAERSRPITVTLPERVLKQIEAINPDRARAIVKAVTAAVGADPDAAKPVEVIEMVPGQGLIVVGPCRALRRIPWLRLVEIAPARYLLVVPTGTAIEILEVALHDLLEHLPDTELDERALLEALRQQISRARRSSLMTKAELLFVSTGG